MRLELLALSRVIIVEWSQESKRQSGLAGEPKRRTWREEEKGGVSLPTLFVLLHLLICLSAATRRLLSLFIRFTSHEFITQEVVESLPLSKPERSVTYATFPPSTTAVLVYRY